MVGDREAGKSTLMAALAAEGVPVLSDDLVVCDVDGTHAGPRCIDLRDEPPAPSRRVRGWTRWRITLDGSPCRAPLGGWIFLDWDADRPRLERLLPAELLVRLAAVRSLSGMASDASLLLELAARPAWRLCRPKDLSRLPDAVGLLRSLV